MRAGARISTTALVLGLGLFMALDVSGQPAPSPIPDIAVRKIIELGLKNIHRALCQGLEQCAPATPEELDNPPITLNHARAAVLAGTRTAFALWCGLDANRRSVLPMTRQLRQVLRFNERQVALMAVIHGIQQGIVADQLKTRGTCDAATRTRIDAQLPKT